MVLTAVTRLTRERDEARADGAREMRERAAAEAMRGNGGVTHAELATIHAVAAKSLALSALSVKKGAVINEATHVALGWLDEHVPRLRFKQG